MTPENRAVLCAQLTVPPELERRGIERVVAWSTRLRVRFRGIDVREGLALLGPAGWGECSPFWDYDPAESAAWLSCALEVATHRPPTPIRDRVPLNVTVPVVSPEGAAALVAARPGAYAAKVKVADSRSSLTDDCARVEAVRAALGPEGRIRVDANCAWDVDQAVSAVRELDRAAGGLDYVEQPCRSAEELAAVRRCVDVRVAADESVRRAADPLRVARMGAADLLVVKVQPLGGISRAARVIEDAGLPVVVSSALDSSIGIWAGMRLAAATELLDGPCGLGTVSLFEGDPAVPSLQVVDSALDAHAPRPGFPDSYPNPVFDSAAGGGAASDSCADLAARWKPRLGAMVAALEL